MDCGWLTTLTKSQLDTYRPPLWSCFYLNPIPLNFRIPRNSFTCVGRLWRSRHNTIDAILIQWHVNELRGILKLLPQSFKMFRHLRLNACGSLRLRFFDTFANWLFNICETKRPTPKPPFAFFIFLYFYIYCIDTYLPTTSWNTEMKKNLPCTPILVQLFAEPFFQIIWIFRSTLPRTTWKKFAWKKHPVVRLLKQRIYVTLT